MLLGSIPHTRKAKDRVSKLLQLVPRFIPASKFNPEEDEEEDDEEEDPFFLVSNKPCMHFNPDEKDDDDDDDDGNISAGAAIAAVQALDIVIPV